MSTESDDRMKDILRRVAVGPKGSRDLAREEARDAMEIVLSGETSDVRRALFLVAMRLKRETLEELLGMLDALRGASQRIQVDLDRVVDLADPYDGFERAPRWGLFTAMVLASCGVPTVVHGGKGIPPKEGCTHGDVLRSLGGRTDKTSAEVGEGLARWGWGYVDLSAYCPGLDALTPLRKEMVKRPALALLEKMIMPVRGRKETLLVSGYVHSAYEELMGELALAADYAGSLIVRGAEGHTDLSIQRLTHASSTNADGEREVLEFDPNAAGVHSDLSLADISAEAEAMADAGRAALGGEAGPAQESIVWTSGMLLSWLGRAADGSQGVAMAREALENGRALAALEDGVAG